MQDQNYAVIAADENITPLLESTSLIQCRIAQANNPGSTVVIQRNGYDWPVDDSLMFTYPGSFELSRFIVAYHDYLTWVICFNDKARWG